MFLSYVNNRRSNLSSDLLIVEVWFMSSIDEFLDEK